MTIQERKESIITAVYNKISELTELRDSINSENNPELYEKVNKSIHNLENMLNRENVYNSVENIDFIKKKYPIFYFCEVDFTDKITFYSSIYKLISKQEDVVDLLTDRHFVKLVLSANDPEIIDCYIELVKKCEIVLPMESFESYLEPIMSSDEEWNRYHLAQRSREDRYCAIGIKLDALTHLREEDIKTAIFTNKLVLETLTKSDQCQDLWFVSGRVYTLPRTVHKKIIAFIKNQNFTKESIENFKRNLYRSEKYRESQDFASTRNQIRRLEKRKK